MIKTPVINIKNLEIGYNTKLCNPINLQAYESEIICITGKNGTGKSTLLKTLAGIIKPLSGEIFYNNYLHTALSLKQKARLISFVPSRLAYFSNIKVFDLIAMGRTPYTNVFDKFDFKDHEIINNAIDLFGLENFRKKPLSEISDGERQKAMICRAFVQNTPVIMLDEPTAFLDYPSKVELLERLQKLSIENKKTILFSSHDLELSLSKASEIWIFNDNKISPYSMHDSGHKQVLKEVFAYEQSEKDC